MIVRRDFICVWKFGSRDSGVLFFYFHENWANLVLNISHFIYVRALIALRDLDKTHLGPPLHTLCPGALFKLHISTLFF